MSQEIVYTSAPQGLKPGSRGFCTVIATQGMARNLAERLESLSGYRHAFAVHDENSHLNPVNYSHLKVTVGGQEYSVLSRICDAGQDYTGRTNKLAHHVALTRSERPPVGPAYQLQQPGFCVEEWDSQTRYTEFNCHYLSSDRPPLTQCTNWSRWCDAGWAGVLAQSALEGKNQTQTIIFPVEAGSSTLALVAEALQLLPEKKRWEVTFSTYFTKLPAGVDCQWRFVLDGTPEADAARRNPRMPLIDLCADPGTAPEGTLVEAARTGQFPQQQETEAAVDVREVPPIPPQATVQQDSTEEFPDLPESTPPVPPPLAKTRRAPGPPPLEKHFRKPKKNSRKLLMGAGVVLLLLLSAGAGYLFMPGQSQDSETVAQTPKTAPRLKNKEVLEVMEQARKKQAPKLILPEKEVKTTEVVIFDHSPLEAEKPEVSTSPIMVKQPLEDVRKIHHCVLPLPPNDHSLNSSSDPFELTKIFATKKQHCYLEILGSDVVFDDGSEFVLKLSPEKKQQWSVIKKTGNGIGQKVVGFFQLNNNSLMFDWDKKPPEKWQYLNYCLLKITVQGDSVLCRLSNPVVEKKSIALDFKSKLLRKKIPILISSLPSAKHLRLIINVNGIPNNGLEGFSKFENVNDSVLELEPINQSTKTLFFNPMTESREPFLDLKSSVTRLHDFYEIELQVEAHEIFLKSDGTNKFESKFVSRDNIMDRTKECKNHIKIQKNIIQKHDIILSQLHPQLDEICKNSKPINKDPKFPMQPDANAKMQDKYVFLQNVIQYCQMKNIKLNSAVLDLFQKIKTSYDTIDKSNKKIEFAINNETRCNKMLELFDHLEREVTIDYELFIKIKDEKVVIVTTSPEIQGH
ncbi:hypothetical protein Enr10x_41220 [Gimesia panareensis]|uniref:Uncharacterized protein n=1 Tax=Gimesia panareensis TaxID=2527978 RepID=A0A517QAX4_9PLAN|nr:hypothetical protein [Gimesia panareensis]QDT28776.1 hypothetical protein Enr10x_41220 [Gimesia panareensis]